MSEPTILGAELEDHTAELGGTYAVTPLGRVYVFDGGYWCASLEVADCEYWDICNDAKSEADACRLADEKLRTLVSRILAPVAERLEAEATETHRANERAGEMYETGFASGLEHAAALVRSHYEVKQ
jgi:hypothetical protein